MDDTLQGRPDSFPAVHNTLASRSQYLTLSENHIFSPALINTFRASYSRTVFVTDSVSSGNTPFLTGRTAGSMDVGGVTTNTYGPQSTTGYVKQNIITWSDDIFWTKGKHALKVGTLINRYGQGIQHNFDTNGGIRLFFHDDVSRGGHFEYFLYSPERKCEPLLPLYNPRFLRAG